MTCSERIWCKKFNFPKRELSNFESTQILCGSGLENIQFFYKFFWSIFYEELFVWWNLNGWGNLSDYNLLIRIG
jgi:hypothetical protein